MNFTPKGLLGAIAAVSIGAATLLGTGAGPAAASGGTHRAHCDRAERPVWSGDPSRNITARGCSVPSGGGKRWYRVEVDTLVERRHKTDYADSPVTGTTTKHDKTVRCMGYTKAGATVNWFGCMPY
ncbi:hypothetical protein AB0D38_37515 [Streptomyces sp. NPDC048279]|jgi:hypothetical protein|uniref:hypothetical protein n=1 Tax=unclassified Streptomyces TaxID=2593676 RepID=UPI00341FA22C